MFIKRPMNEPLAKDILDLLVNYPEVEEALHEAVKNLIHRAKVQRLNFKAAGDEGAKIIQLKRKK